MRLDPASFPNTAAFLDRLPDAWASFPECQVHRSAIRGALVWIDEQGGLDQLPEDLASYLDLGDRDDWIPDCVGSAVLTMMFDLLGEEQGLTWFYDDSARLFNRPILRHLMRVLSPTLLVMGAAQRWSMLRRGTSLSVTPVKRTEERAGAEARVVFPEGLYPRLLLLGVAQSFRAGIDGTRANEVRCELVDVATGEAKYLVSWRA